MKHITAIFTFASILHLSAFAAVPLRWTVETSRAQPATFESYQGETLDFEATLQSYGKPLEAPVQYAFYWQTNGMGSAYWSAPCTVPGASSPRGADTNLLRATWLPSYDVGARAYNCFIGLSNSIYHAAFQLRLRPSPGAVPNELPLPQKVIDFSQVTVLNPPWSGGGGSGGVDTNAVIDIIHETVDGSARPLPPYLHAIDFNDTYPDDAAWFYAQHQPYGSCSAVRDGGFLYRNYDWRLDDDAEFVVRVTAGEGRFASLGVANCGTNLTDQFVTSGKWSRFYKCLPGRTVDGINENGVVAEVNVVGGDPHDRWPTNGTIHCMGAVRWVLDHATDAGTAASNLVEHLYFPDGFTQNFHWMVADERETWIVENGACSNVTGRAVMTNFQLLPEKVYGPGWERYILLEDSFANITNAWYTRAYSRETEWVSEFKDQAEMEAAKSAWETYGRDALRGKGLWQTVHCSVYDISNRTLRVAVQEQPDWYTFAIPGGTGVSPVQIREIVQPMIADATNDLNSTLTDTIASATNAVPRIVMGNHEIRADLTAKVQSGWTDQWEPNSTATPEKIERHETYYGYPQFDNGDWRCVTYLFDEEINDWVSYYTDFMSGDSTNPDATELTFPDGTVTLRIPATSETRLVTTNQLPTASQLLTNDQRTEISKVKDKADEFTAWDFHNHPATSASTKIVTSESEEWSIENLVYPYYQAGIIEHDELSARCPVSNEDTGYFGYVNATRKRVLRTGEAATTNDIAISISTNNPAFVSAVQSIAPSSPPSLRLYDEVRGCWWIGRMVNGVISWEVEE